MKSRKGFEHGSSETSWSVCVFCGVWGDVGREMRCDWCRWNGRELFWESQDATWIQMFLPDLLWIFLGGISKNWPVINQIPKIYT